MSWHVTGLATDHTASIQSLLKDYLQSNWSSSVPVSGYFVKFSTGWYDEQNQFQVHVRHDIAMPVNRITLGNRPMNKYNDMCQVHCFAEEQQDNAEPANLDKMCNEVARIVGSNTTGLESSQGVCTLEIASTPRVLPVEMAHEAAIFHSVQKVRLIYHKVFS